MINITYILDRNACIELQDTFTPSHYLLGEYLYDVIVNFRWLDAIIVNGAEYPISFQDCDNLDRDSLRLSLDAIKI